MIQSLPSSLANSSVAFVQTAVFGILPKGPDPAVITGRKSLLFPKMKSFGCKEKQSNQPQAESKE